MDELNECNCDAHKKKGTLNYYITRWRQEVRSVLKPDPLVTRCGRETQHPAPSRVGPRLSIPGERERNATFYAKRGPGRLIRKKKLCIMWVAAVNSFARVLNSRRGEHIQAVSLYHNLSVWSDTKGIPIHSATLLLGHDFNIDYLPSEKNGAWWLFFDANSKI